jgi:UDPglucose 6-dehydrogenase
MIGEVLIRSGLAQDVDRALAAIGADSRIGHKYLRYGFGYGGPCLPRDNRAFAHYANRVGVGFSLGEIVDQFNHDHTHFLAEYIFEQNTQKLPFYMPSLTYKPYTDIVEESQQLQLCQGLVNRGADVYVEPCDMLPDTVKQELGGRVRFVSKQDLDSQNIKYFEIKL